MEENMHASDIACSLSDEAFRERRATMRNALLPHLINGERMESGLRLAFADTAALRSRVESFIHMERQCCGFRNMPRYRLGLSSVAETSDQGFGIPSMSAGMMFQPCFLAVEMKPRMVAKSFAALFGSEAARRFSA